MNQVIACIDGVGATAASLCDAASWASQRLGAPLTLLHVLDRSQYPVDTDMSGTIGLGSREALLQELASLDEQRITLAREQGRLMLEAAQARAEQRGVAAAATLQRHGELSATLNDLAPDTRLLVIGRGGSAETPLSPQVANVIRTLQRPMLVLDHTFNAPQRFLIAYDGSPTARKALELVAASPLLAGLPCELLLVGPATADVRMELEAARDKLLAKGFSVNAQLCAGEPDAVILATLRASGADLLVMGAYGHSRIRQLLVGSTTAKLLRNAPVPVLLLR